MPTYKHKRTGEVVHAIKFDGTPDGAKEAGLLVGIGKLPGITKGFFLRREDGNLSINAGEFIVANSKGRHRMTADEFESSYEPLVANIAPIPPRPAPLGHPDSTGVSEPHPAD